MAYIVHSGSTNNIHVYLVLRLCCQYEMVPSWDFQDWETEVN